MTQLILDTTGYNIALPESERNYQAYREDLAVEVPMVTGRIVREIRGTVWHVVYQFGYFDNETKNKVIAACEKGRRQTIKCGFLPPESTGELSYSDFFVTSFTYPKFMWSAPFESDEEPGTFVPKPMWADFAVELREVKPSD